jgi:hypothetical protein
MAVAMLPVSRREWRAAMLSDLEHIESDWLALHWAAGCVLVGIKERFRDMARGNLGVSRWILVAEMALCFIPLTIAWLDFAIGSWSDVPPAFAAFSLDTPGAGSALAAMLGGATIGVLGPVGLFVALRALFFGRRVSPMMASVLVVGPLLLGVLLFSAFATSSWLDTARDLILLSVLPGLGVAHLLALSKPSAGIDQNARLAS